MAGRPTKYKPKYCKDIIKFFDVPCVTTETITLLNAKGETYEKPVVKASNLPTLEAFSHKIGVDTDTLLNWSKKHKAFFGAVSKAKQLQKNILVQNGLMGYYDAGFAKFVASNFTDMKEKQEIEHSGEIKTALVEFVDGQSKDSNTE